MEWAKNLGVTRMEWMYFACEKVMNLRDQLRNAMDLIVFSQNSWVDTIASNVNAFSGKAYKEMIKV
jgi:hypothetical protein